MQSKIKKTIIYFVAFATILWSLGIPVSCVQAQAQGAAPIVISEVQTAGTSDTKQEFIEIYNRTEEVIDIHGWDLAISSDGVTWTQIVDDIGSAHNIPAHGFDLYLNPTLSGSINGVNGASGNANWTDLSATGGFIALRNAGKNIIDKVGYGTLGDFALHCEGGHCASAPSAGGSIERKARGDSTPSSMAAEGRDAVMGNGWDSDDNTFDFVLRTTPQPQNLSSGAENPTQEGTLSGGGIMHTPINKATAGFPLVVSATMGDPLTSPDQLTTMLYYLTGDNNPSDNTILDYSTTSGTHLGNGNFQFVTTGTNVGSGSNGMHYFLKMTGSSGTRYMSGSPEADMTCDTTCNTSLIAQNPFVVEGVVAGNKTITGIVKDRADNAVIGGAKVILEGSEYETTTAADGAFTLSNVRDNVYNLNVSASGYYEARINDINVNQNTDLGIVYMDQGQSGGMSGDTTKPHITWTGPSDGMSGLPAGDPNFKIFIGFDKEIDSSTFIAANVFLTTDGTNAISGFTNDNLTYDNNPSQRDAQYPHDQYLGIVSVPSGGLTENTTYYLVMSGAVRDTVGNSLQGNRPEGGHVVSFSTGGGSNYNDYAGQAGAEFGSGQMMPPFVMGAIPIDGAMNVAQNTKIGIKFVAPIKVSSANATNIKLYGPISDYSVPQAQWTPVSLSDSNFALDTSQTIVIITPSSNLSAGDYELTVSGAIQGTDGIWLGDPGQNQNISTHIMFQSHFEIGSSADNTAPTVSATYPADGATGVSVNKGKVEIQFSEMMDPTTINANTISLKRGSNIVSSEIAYDPMSQSTKIMPNTILATETNYTINVSTGVKDIAGNSLASADVRTFTTSAIADNASPEISFANGDDWEIALTFTEPMNSAKPTEATRYTTSVLNPANYIIKWGDSSTVVSSGTTIDLSNTSFSYDPMENTVFIEGLGLSPDQVSGKDYYIDVTPANVSGSGVCDLSGNTIANATTFQFPISLSSDTGGFLGPMGTGGGGMMGPNMGDMGMMKAGVFPMNMMAGQTSVYFVDVPLTKAFNSGGRVVLTFPEGFDISNVVADPHSPTNNDMNGPGPGTVTFKTTGVAADSVATTQGGAANDGITINSDANTITIWLNVAGTGIGDGTQTTAQDFLHIDIDQIRNHVISKSFETSGYNIGMKVMDSDGSLLENINTMPFFLTEGGQLSLGGNITLSEAAGGAGGTVEICLGSQMTGPMCQNITFGGADTVKPYSFTGLVAGEYNIFTEPTITLNNNDYMGIMMPEPIFLNASKANQHLALNKMTAIGKATVTVQVTGTFAAGGEDIDIFAGSPEGSRLKTKTLTGAVTNDSTTLYLGNGDWMVGMGPAMPMGTMAGPPPMPDWMPPMPTRVIISGCPGSCVVEEHGNATVTGANTTDGTLTYTVATANKLIIGKVTKEDGTTAIPDAEVYAYQPMGDGGGMGGHAVTDSSGNFTLKVAALGNYKVGAFKPGVPGSPEKTVAVEANNAATTDNNDSCDVRVGNSLITTTNLFIIKLQKPDYTISGKVTDGTNPVAYTPVWADRTDGPGHADTMTDSSGNYIIYVTAGTWNVRAYAPSVGDLGPEVVVITDSSKTRNLTPGFNAATEMYNISGNISIGGTPRTFEPVRAAKFDANGNYLGREFGSQTDSNGNYTISVPAGIYRVDIWTPEYGEVEAISDSRGDEYPNSPASLLISADVSDVNISIAAGNLQNVTISFTNGAGYSGTEAFVDIEKIDPITHMPVGLHQNLKIPDVSTNNTIQLPDGDYLFRANVQGLGEFIPQEAGDATSPGYVDISAEGTVHFVLPDVNTEMVTISGNVDDGTNPVSDAWVWIGNPQTGQHRGIATDNSGNYSLNVQKLAAGSNYKMGADKPDYLGAEPIDIAGDASSTQNFTLTAANFFISGVIYNDADSDYTYDSGEEISHGFVWAENTVTGGAVHSPVEPDGTYTLPVVNGSWKVFAVGDGYKETPYRVGLDETLVAVSGSSQENINIYLDADTSWTAKFKSKPIVPASGGVVDDTATDGSGVKVTVPASSLGTGTGQGQITVKETSSVAKTSAFTPLGMKGKEIKAIDNSGQAITNLNGDINLEIVYYKADIVEAGLEDYSKLKTLTLGYLDETAGEWVTLATVRTAYTKATATSTEFTAQSDYDAFVDNLIANKDYYADYKIVFKASTSHLSIFGAINPTDAVAPAAPTGLTATAGNGQVTLDWADNAEADLMEYEIYRDTGTGVLAINSKQVNTSQVATSAYTDSGLTNWTSYYYVVTAADDSGNESAVSSEVQVCPNPGATNGTVGNDCGITCNAGYTQSGNSCIFVSTGGVPAVTSAPPAMAITTTGKVAVSPSSCAKTTVTSAESTTATVQLPTQAVSASTQVNVTPVAKATVIASTAAAPAGRSIVGGYVYNFTAVSAGEAVTSFSRPVTITLTYTDAQIKGIKESTLKIGYWGDTESEWVSLDTAIDKTTKTLTAETTHFTYFSIIGETEEPTEALTEEELQAKIVEITKQISDIKARLIELLKAKIQEIAEQIAVLKIKLTELKGE